MQRWKLRLAYALTLVLATVMLARGFSMFPAHGLVLDGFIVLASMLLLAVFLRLGRKHAPSAR